MYLDINVIQSFNPNCMNLDDAGNPKTCTYGGVRRSRVSSQCWKKAIRDDFRISLDPSDMGVRTSRIVGLIADIIMENNEGFSREDALEKSAEVVSASGMAVKPKTKGNKTDCVCAIPETPALFFVSRKQAAALADMAVSGGYDKRAVKNVLNSGFGVDTALFGRMVAEEPLLDTVSSVQMAHAISTHSCFNQYDFFTANDDLAAPDRRGSTLLSSLDFSSSTMYRFATVSIHDLMDKLQDAEYTARATREFLRAFVMTVPSGKQSSFGSQTLPFAVYVALRRGRPVNLVSAFEMPVETDPDSGGYDRKSLQRMIEYELRVRRMFGVIPIRTWQIGDGMDELGPASDLESVLGSVEGTISEEVSG